MYNCATDGIDHINIYSKARTEIGRYLTNFARSPINTVHGSFESIEGYWYWLSTGNDTLRNLYGFNAKKFGKTLPRTYALDKEVFEQYIKQACWNKLHSNSYYYRLFIESSLPFTHYYVFGNASKDAGFKWLVEMWEFYRQYLKNQNT